jgi:hypothetical protein
MKFTPQIHLRPLNQFPSELRNSPTLGPFGMQVGEELELELKDKSPTITEIVLIVRARQRVAVAREYIVKLTGPDGNVVSDGDIQPAADELLFQANSRRKC